MTIRPLTTTFAALAVAGLLGACGGGSDDSSDGDSGDGGSGEQAAGDGQEMYDWVECMAGEGIELPEPSRNADGNLVIVGDGVDIGDSPQISFGQYSEEEFDAGVEACGPPPIRAGLSEESLREEEENALAMSQCMRENGVEDFPDPDFSDDMSDGMLTPWPVEDMEQVQSDPDFQAADEECRGLMFPDGEEPVGDREDEEG